MKFILLTISAALLFSACSGSKDTEPPVKPDSTPAPEPQLEPEPEPEPETKPEVSIHEAARTGNLEAIRQFINSGADLDEAGPVIGSPLTNAIVYNHIEIVKVLIKEGANVNIRKKSDGNTPVHSAAFFAYPETLKLLLDAGAEKAPKNLKGELPIGITLIPWENAQGIYLLVGNLLNSVIGENKVPMDLPRIKESLPEIFELLSDGKEFTAIEKPDDENAAEGTIFGAALAGDIDAIRKAIAAGYDLDLKDENGSTALITASSFGRQEAVIALIKGGADPNLKNNRGDTPLLVAAFFCREEIVKALLENGADREIANNDGSRPIDTVAAPWSEDLEDLYKLMETLLKPIAPIEMDLERIRKARPRIAEMLR
jgi:ankyrin repeat protein